MMSNNLNLIKELRDRTSLGLADCKKALAQSNDNIDAAIDLLKTWGELKGKEKENKVATEGVIATLSNDNGNTTGLCEINCQTDFVSRGDAFKEFVGLVCKSLQSKNDIEAARKELIAKTGENIVIRRNTVWSGFNPFSIKHIYSHSGNLAAMVEVSVSNEKYISHPDFIEFVDDAALQIAAMSAIVVSKEDLSEDILSRQQKIFEAQLTEDKKPISAWPKIIEGKFAKWRKDIVLLEQESVKVSGKSIGQILNDLSKKLNTTITINRFVRYSLGEGLIKEQDNLADEVNKLIGDK